MYARRYVQAQNETASPERLMVLLFETALRHIRTSIVALEAGRFQEAALASEKAGQIVAHLDVTFDRSKCPALGEQVGQVYKFTGQRLLMGVVRRDPKMFRDAERAFAPVADAFAKAVQLLPTGGAR
jgi:flagellar secretion chaperone FliS